MHRAFRDENRSVKNHRNTITMDTYIGTCTAIYMASSYRGDNNIIKYIMFDCELYSYLGIFSRNLGFLY